MTMGKDELTFKEVVQGLLPLYFLITLMITLITKQIEAFIGLTLAAIGVLLMCFSIYRLRKIFAKWQNTH